MRKLYGRGITHDEYVELLDIMRSKGVPHRAFELLGGLATFVTAHQDEAEKVIKTEISASFEVGELITLHTLVNSQLCEMRAINEADDEYKSELAKISERIQRLINL